MRYLTVYEFSPEDAEKVVKTLNETTTIREMNPDKFPKILLDVHDILGETPRLTEGYRSFSVHEADDPEQLYELSSFWKSKMPETKSFKMYFVPIADHRSMSWMETIRQGRMSPSR